MDFSFSSLFSSFLFSVIGIYVFREGKRRTEIRVIILGLALMVYSYFTKGPWADWGIGVVLTGLAYYWLR